MNADRSGVCRHGALRRSCETCDLAEDLATVEAERDALRRDAERWKNECYLMAAHQAGDTMQRLLDERDALKAELETAKNDVYRLSGEMP